MSENNAITIPEELRGKPYYIKCTSQENFSLSTIDTITSICIPMKAEDETDEEFRRRILENSENS